MQIHETIPEIKAYIRRTRIPVKAKENYNLWGPELRALRNMASDGYVSNDVWDAIGLAYDFGMARGYRAARAGVRK